MVNRLFWGVVVSVMMIGVVVGAGHPTFFADIDTLYMTRDKMGNLSESIQLLETKLGETDLTADMKYQCFWRLARSISYIDDYMEAERDTKLKLYEKGRAYAEQAVAIRPDGSEGYYWSGVVLGKAAELRGVLESLFAVGPIEKNMKKVIELSPDWARSYFVLARLYRKAPPYISVGNINKAYTMIQKARALDSKDSFIELEYATILIAKKKKKEAEQVLISLIALTPNASEFMPSVEQNKQEAAALLETLR